MSLSSLSNLKSDTNKEKNKIVSLESRYNSFVKELESAFGDEVGVNAKESIISIKNKISFDINSGCAISQNSILELEQGYIENKNAENEIKDILNKVESIMREINNVR